MGAVLPDIPEARKFQQILESLRTDVDKLKSSSSAPQLGSSSIDVFQGRGFIPIMEAGVEKHRIGRQPDGTITSVSKNNTDPPATPLEPVCVPFIGGVTVTCTGFTSKQFLDFSHVRVYVDNQLTDCIMKIPGAVAIAPLDSGPHTFYLKSVNLSDTASPSSPVVIASPNLVVGNDITDGIIDTLKLANDAVTNAKIAAEAVTGTKIAAETIEGSMIAAETIFAENIAAGQITTEKIQTLAVVADKIAANAVTAGKIEAGSVTAEKLAATIVLASTAIIVGNPTLARLVLDASGLTQVDAQGNIALQIGASPTQGNFLTVIDPNDSTNALATIGKDGNISVNGISITGPTYLNGVDLIQYLNSRPQGIIAEGTFNGAFSAGTSGEIGVFEVQFQVVAGRSYVISSDNFGCYGMAGYSVLRATIDGSTPTVASSIISYIALIDSTYQTGMGSSGYDTNPVDLGGPNSFAMHNHGILIPPTSGSHNVQIDTTGAGTVRVLLTIGVSGFRSQSNNSNAVVFEPGTYSPVYLRAYNNKVTLRVEDLGSSPTLTGGVNQGGGTSNANGQFVRTFTPTYTKFTRDGLPAAGMVDGLQMGKGGNYNYFSMIGFDQSAIAVALSGATIDKVELYLYSNYWAVSEGGYVSIGTHNVSGTPTSYSYVVRDYVQAKMKKPQGLWIGMPTLIGTALATGSIKGLVLDCRASYPAATNFGIFRELTYTDATVRPSLRITFRK